MTGKEIAAGAILGVIAIVGFIALFSANYNGGLATMANSPQSGNNLPDGNTGAIGNQAVQPAAAITTFTDNDKALETIDGKPVIRLFSTTWCPHCKWIKETFDRVAIEYVEAGKIVAYHWELDTSDDTLTEEAEGVVPETELAVFKASNPGGSIPTFNLGGKFIRVGNGFEGIGDFSNPDSAQSKQHLILEEKELRAAIEKLIEEAKQ